MEIEKISYDGHSYIKFVDEHHKYMAILHDPDCGCSAPSSLNLVSAVSNQAENMTDINTNDIKEYLRQCKAKTVDDLSDEQVLAWARSGNMGLNTKVSAEIVEHGVFGECPDRAKAISLLKNAIKKNKEFFCSYVEDESADGPNISKAHGSFEMYLK